tara:strand:+ start:1200 stop:2219 length:1020 start_codon:yes stop_codon:yes gene_type:complete
MKVAIGYKIINTPWGGGNQFAKSLSNYLVDKGHKVTNKLEDKNIDIILLTDPRRRSKNVSFGTLDIIFYLLFKNPKAIVVHRINECDERKNTKLMNAKLRIANYISDHTVFIASWLKNLNLWNKKTSNSIILNGANKKIFNNKNNHIWDGLSPIKIITHHWGGNLFKGFDIYSILDDLLGKENYKNLFKFTYIGNLPKDFKFTNTALRKPLSDFKLSEEIQKHHIYLTASINEPAGMHHIEGALCGLPLLYRDSGALPEYCDGFGLIFNKNNFIEKLKQIRKDYFFYKENLINYPHSSSKMSFEYEQLFLKLIKNKKIIIKKRNLLRNPFKFILNIFLF